MPPSALVTGATGFIGSHLVEILISLNWKITCLIRPKGQTRFLQTLPVTLVKYHWNDQKAFEKAVQGHDYIFHLAARIRSAPKKVYDRANVQMTSRLVHACLKRNSSIKRFVYISSISAAGPSSPYNYSDETRSPSPTSEYGRTKLKGEEIVQKLWDRLPSTIIRPPNVYGPRQQETEMLIKLIKKRIVPILKIKKEITSMIYVQDLIQGILKATFSSKTEKQIYYLCNSKGYSWREIILTLKKHVLGNKLFFPLPENTIILFAWLTDRLKNVKIVKTYFGQRAWRTMTQTPWLFSSLKAKKDFGFQAQYSLDKGIQETVKFYN